MGDSVKIDKDLLDKVNVLIKEMPFKIKYSTAKQFINVAVLELLEKEGKKGEKDE